MTTRAKAGMARPWPAGPPATSRALTPPKAAPFALEQPDRPRQDPSVAHELLFFPDYRVANPYQRLLYDHAGAELHPRPGTVDDGLGVLRRKAAGERVIFHLHWDDAVYRNELDEPAAWRAAQAFLDGIEAFVDAGGLLLWTLHNTAPHDDRYLPVHEALSARLPQLADLVH